MNKIIDNKSADNIRVLSAAMVEKANSGHPGGPMGGADFIHILYSEFLRFDPNDPQWIWRDRFFLDPGHLSAMLYAQLYLLGNYSKHDVGNFRQWGSVTPGHPEIDHKRGIENTSGPLGQGHAMGIGAALAAKFLQAKFGDWTAHYIYAYISDGGIQEEISQGVGRIAGYLGLDNIIMFFDANDVQLSTYTNEVTSENTAKKYESWGWEVISIDGHDHNQIRQAITDGQKSTKPILIIGKTIMGKGCVNEEGQPYEGHTELHGKPLSGTGASFDKTITTLGGKLEDPFLIFEEVSDYYQKIKSQKSKEVSIHRKTEQKWRLDNAGLAEKLDLFFNGGIPDIDFSGIAQKSDIATRAASAAVLGQLAGKVENLIVASADLANSDKTDGYLKKVNQFQPGMFNANFFHAGVSEFSMAAMANGMALHGGVIPVVGTFFIFSDYQKPAIRLSALMELHVIYLWTHDAFRVGEDGPTHQPVEQEAQIRLMEKLKNHSKKQSFVALRPADAAETNVAWQMALTSPKTPTGLIFSRQNIKDISAKQKNRFEEAREAVKGAYLVRTHKESQVTLLASGSEVSTLMEAADLLSSEGIESNVVSVISEGLFRNQTQAYQTQTLGDQPIYGLTAGLPVTLEGLVGKDGKVEGLEHFGYSAPAKILDEKFGFTGQQVFGRIMTFLGR